MKKIGFVDYYLSEWHANNYPAWIRELCKEQGLEYEIAYAWGEIEVSPRDGKTNTEWCAENGVELCKTMEEVCEKSDVLLILAPSNPEKHLEYAKTALKYGKLTYIDKTFTPCFADAKEIFDLADRYGTKCFSTSALRYASELDELKGAQQVVTTGGGRSADEYLVHQVEMIVKLLGVDATAVKTEWQGKQGIFRIAYGDQKSATAIYDASLPFAVTAELEDGSSKAKNVNSDFFRVLMEKILNFYETGETDFCRCETLAVMKIREELLANGGAWEKI